MFKKIKLFKKVLELSKEIKAIAKENDKTIQELRHFLETAVLLYPQTKELINEIIELVKDDSNKKV
jgi:5-bromo-4-chloroindolyl phosphate hydrolysis protein